MWQIDELQALEILDSRGRPTLQVTCVLRGGSAGTAQVPSGASTGRAEARELRDGDPQRHAGLGCRKAVANVLGPIQEGLRTLRMTAPHHVDERLIELDGTADKSHLGANALLGVSLAAARALATAREIPLYRQFAEMVGSEVQRLPRLTVNLFSGGKHAGGQVPVQDLLLVPASATTIDEGLEMVCAVYRTAAELIQRKYAMRLLTADEGGLAPPFPSVDAMLEDTLTAISAAGLEPGRDVSVAMDVAASHFYHEGHYWLGAEPVPAEAIIDLASQWVRDYPLVSVEDALAEDDWEHWSLLTERIGRRTLVVGDDLLCTNPVRIQQAIERAACNTLLLKVNQIGTLTEASEALRLARSAGWHVTISARSGETEDNWLADLAVGWNADQIKVGSVTQSERLAKYNRLLAIEAETQLPVTSWPIFPDPIAR